MAINKNHEFEDLNGIKCAVVEKNVSPERVGFLKQLLEFNNYTVVIVPTPPPKAAPAVPKEGETTPAPAPVASATFTVGVTNLSFNAVNAVFGRMLRTKDGHIVTLAYWNQKDSVSHDDIPYFEKE
ncbi:MAG: hypothetical protein JST17_08530 [Bacteroidetes bacterium]|nr:hypothetical protein [Bacteroidota bacterium]MBS1930778.1 hypothetical protein [Bacteroidota bacterium]